MSEREIIAQDLKKYYENGDVKAVDGVSFHVKAGEIYGFLGPNGAGKSTIIGMLTTLSLPTSGTASIGGFDVIEDPSSVRRVAGVALQEIGLDPLMKSVELLTIQAQMFGQTRKQATNRAYELLEIVKLADVTDRPVGKYSGGMRRRLDLALALVHEPSILFLDEPTTGLDPASRRDVWTEVRRLNVEKGMTIFLTTQYLEEADELADRIAIIDRGRLQVEGQPAELKSSLGAESINVVFNTLETAERARDQLADMGRVQIDRKTVRLYMPGAATAIPAVVNRLNDNQMEPLSLTLTQPTLDDVFLQVTGQRFDDEDTESTESAEPQPV